MVYALSYQRIVETEFVAVYENPDVHSRSSDPFFKRIPYGRVVYHYGGRRVSEQHIVNFFLAHHVAKKWLSRNSDFFGKFMRKYGYGFPYFHLQEPTRSFGAQFQFVYEFGRADDYP